MIKWTVREVKYITQGHLASRDLGFTARSVWI